MSNSTWKFASTLLFRTGTYYFLMVILAESHRDEKISDTGAFIWLLSTAMIFGSCFAECRVDAAEEPADAPTN